MAALRRYRILDTREEGSFARLTEEMAHTFRVPIAAVTFVDERRQWFKAGYGLGVRETPRALSFCAQALERAEPLVVRDARLDLRFARNPLVCGPLGVRFYAGARLLDPEGHALGAACIIDRRPRPEGLSPVETARLMAFAERAMAHADLHLFRLEWLEHLPRAALERAAAACQRGETGVANRLVNLAYAAVERREDIFDIP
ncbi:GAF domain-containing protein [Roseomonas sp. CCTCC AB2023176]|uniref:GAF domain-containing protein n=1 Tax=Roseomonas sp. CCTCC AB2023176 TaxID=3342640 RepID=UPI0035E17E11